MNGVREQVLLLGCRKSMLGIVAESALAGEESGRPVVVILNAGIIHRVGPSRIHVAMARSLAAIGYRAVRFDLSGIGDSERRPDVLAPLDAALADIREALDSLESEGQNRRFVLVGLCSGADQALVYAAADPRIVGVVLIDPHIPRTRRYYLHYYRGRLFRLSSWLNLLPRARGMRRTGRENIDTNEERPDEQLIQALSSGAVRTFLENAYQKTLAGNNRILAIFTGGVEAQHCYREQLLHAFPKVRFGDNLQLEYFKSADHMFQTGTERERLIGTIGNWLQRVRFAGA